MEKEIIGKRRKNILEQLFKSFRYNAGYWIPLRDIKIDKEYIVVSGDLGLEQNSPIEAFLKNKSKSFYLTGEVGYMKPFCSEWLQEVDYLDLTYGPVEFVYFDKDYSWMIYISHEDTITFCGNELVNFIKDHCKLSQRKSNE